MTSLEEDAAVAATLSHAVVGSTRMPFVPKATIRYHRMGEHTSHTSRPKTDSALSTKRIGPSQEVERQPHYVTSPLAAGFVDDQDSDEHKEKLEPPLFIICPLKNSGCNFSTFGWARLSEHMSKHLSD